MIDIVKNSLMHFGKKKDSKCLEDADMEMLKQAMLEFTTQDPDKLKPEQLAALREKLKNMDK